MSYHRQIVGSGFCKNCEEDVDVYMEDVGIGSYEFWGAKGYHSEMGYFCAECDDEIDEFDPYC